jgi:archaeosine synthase
MMEFLINRGHDGPARVSTLKLGSKSIALPCLLGDNTLPSLNARYATLSRDEPLNDNFNFIALPSLVTQDDLSKEVPNESAIILPSLVSGEFLGSQAAKIILDNQVQIIKNIQDSIEPARCIIRIPFSIEMNELPEVIKEFTTLNIEAALLPICSLKGEGDLKAFSIRSELPSNWLILAVGRIEPYMVPFLYYFGFDAIDIGWASNAAIQKIRLWPMRSERITDSTQSRFCSCTACSQIADLRELPDEALIETLTLHNVSMYMSLLSECIHAMNNGTLRGLVETYTHASPAAAELLRNIDKQLYSFIEEFTPTTGSVTLPLIGPESYNAPSIRRFRERLLERYQPPPNKKTILLIPCSARKPYSDSKSHRRFERVIQSSLGGTRFNLAEVILTSPLGVVPRELERIFPASRYDIPVTGDWDSEEIEIASRALIQHLSKFDESTPVVAHVIGGYRDIVTHSESEISQSIIYTTETGSVTSRNALQALYEVLTDLKDILSLKAGPPTYLQETLRATADYQFGPGAGFTLMPDGTQMRGKLYRTVVCQIGNQQTCTFVAENGILSLTLEGGRRIQSLDRYWVRFEGKDLKGGSLFAIGIEEADPLIRPGDEVIVVDKHGDVIAVGRSEMSGREMSEFGNGRAISIRHKAGD